MRRRILSGLALVALAIGLVVSTPIASSANENHIKKAATGQERAPVIRTGATVKTAPSLSAGLLQAANEALDRADADSGGGSLSVSKSSLGCAQRLGGTGNGRHRRAQNAAQVDYEVLHRLVAIGGIFFEGLVDDVAEQRRQVGTALGERGRRGAADRFEHQQVGDGLEWADAGQQLVEQNPE